MNLLTLFLTASVTAAEPPPAPPVASQTPCPNERKGMVCADTLTYQNQPVRLCVLNTLNLGAEWFIFKDSPPHEKIETPPPVSMFQVIELSVSPNQQFLAVLSVGEGHPILDVFDLQTLLQNKPIEETLYTLNPYPNVVNISEWVDDTHLGVEIVDFGVEWEMESKLPANCPELKFILDVPQKTLSCRTASP